MAGVGWQGIKMVVNLGAGFAGETDTGQRKSRYPVFFLGGVLSGVGRVTLQKGITSRVDQ